MKNMWLWIVVVVVVLLGGYYLMNMNQPVQQDGTMMDQTYPADSPESQNAEADDTIMTESTVVLSEQNASGENGTVTLREVGGKVVVSVSMTGAPETAQPAHIHAGSCPTPGAVVYPLTNVVNGMSETTLDVSMMDLKSQMPLAVNLHKSAQEASVYVACGDVML